jgi:hypothetical protein
MIVHAAVVRLTLSLLPSGDVTLWQFAVLTDADLPIPFVLSCACAT